MTHSKLKMLLAERSTWKKGKKKQVNIDENTTTTKLAVRGGKERVLPQKGLRGDLLWLPTPKPTTLRGLDRAWRRERRLGEKWRSGEVEKEGMKEEGGNRSGDVGNMGLFIVKFWATMQRHWLGALEPAFIKFYHGLDSLARRAVN